MDFEAVKKARKDYQDQLHSGRVKTVWISAIIALIISTIFGTGGAGVATIVSFAFCFFFSFVVGYIITYYRTQPQALAYRRAYKGYFVEQNLAKVFTDLRYDHDKGLNPTVLRNTRMLQMGSIYSSNDLTLGKYKSVSLAQADVHIQDEYTDSDGDTHYVTIMKGRVMIFEFPKKFNFKLELIGRKFRPYLIPEATDKSRVMVKIETESDEFNQAFKVFGEDGFEEFYILDPAFMVKIQAISEQHQNKVLFGFMDNKLFIVLNDGNDSFEPPKPNKPINEQAELARVSTDIKVITDFIDQLSLDRKLFK